MWFYYIYSIYFIIQTCCHLFWVLNWKKKKKINARKIWKVAWHDEKNYVPSAIFDALDRYKRYSKCVIYNVALSSVQK